MHGAIVKREEMLDPSNSLKIETIKGDRKEGKNYLIHQIFF